MQWSPVSKAELPAYLKKAAALLAVATVLGGCSGQPSDAEPKQHLPEKSKQLPRPQQRPLQLQLQQNCCNWLGKLTFLNRILR